MARRSWATLWSTFELALQNLSLHKLRSFLTILGTLLGVASVISMLAIGEGSKRKAIEHIRNLGASNVIIRTVKPEDDKSSWGGSSQQSQSGSQETQIQTIEYGLTYKDFDRLKETIPHVNTVVPITLVQTTAQRGRLQIKNARILGTTPDLLHVKNLKLRRGNFIGWPHLRSTDNVAVLSQGAARRLFAYRDPLGKNVLFGTQAFRVIGILQRQSSGNTTPGAVDQADLNDDIYIPLTTSQRRVGESRQVGPSIVERIELHEITLTVDDERYVKAAAGMAKRILAQSHPKATDYEIQVPLELLEQAERERRIWNLVLGSIAGISLLVGGIGIMNIMLATVTERTREIGLRMAVGATRGDIIVQFLVESTTLSAVGGLLGIALGAGIPLVVSLTSDIQTVVSWWSIFLAFGISVFLGVLFGVYPARRAAEMDPIEALRQT